MVVAFYFRLHLAYFPRPVVAIFARPEQNSKVTIPQWLECHNLVGLRIVVGVIRRSNGKPLGRSGFVGFGQICRELQKNPGGVAVQCLRGLFR